jgi:hypothetical protein
MTWKRCVSGIHVAFSHGDMTMTDAYVPVVMEDVTDPEELAKAHAQRERFDRNAAWLQAHVAEIYSRYRGKCICIAGEELFVADTPEEVLELATAAHPDDDGRFLRYIPREKLDRIYAH